MQSVSLMSLEAACSGKQLQSALYVLNNNNDGVKMLDYNTSTTFLSTACRQQPSMGRVSEGWVTIGGWLTVEKASWLVEKGREGSALYTWGEVEIPTPEEEGGR